MVTVNKTMIGIAAFVILAGVLRASTDHCQTKQINAASFSKIDELVNSQISCGNIPGAVVLIGQGERTVYFKAFGNSVVEPFVQAMQKDTLFDLASLTKPVSTAPAVLILSERGLLDLNDKAAKYIPEFGKNGKANVQIQQLLTHTSGLPPYTDANELSNTYGPVCPEQTLDKICSLPLTSEPGKEFRYSCLGYIVLARIVQAVSGKFIDEFAGENIFKPLQMDETCYNPPGTSEERIAGVSLVNGNLHRGKVHDPLASLMDGVSGNAGLFSTAEDLAKFCKMVLNDGRFNGRQVLSKRSIELLTTEQACGRAFGFDVNSSFSYVKGKFGPKAFCHTGYTGTSIVCDPESKTYIILLTNRVHPHDKGNIKFLREEIADIVAQSIINQ